MKVILLKDVPKLGKAHDIKNVSGGYATNYLIPNGLAESATDKKIKDIEVKKEVALEEKEIQNKLFAKNLASLKSASIKITTKANEKGHLFQGVHKNEIIQALKEQSGIDLLPEHIILEHTIKEVGEYEIHVQAGKKSVGFKLIVKNEGS